tara:strand:- start:5368 stop:5988 length:621 start_codon:yes stop_codon:yes gene_type:complete
MISKNSSQFRFSSVLGGHASNLELLPVLPIERAKRTFMMQPTGGSCVISSGITDGGCMTDIFTRLKQDHDRHRAMLERVADTSGDSQERREAFEQLRIDVSAHANAEEQSLYAEMLARPDLQDKGRHSVAEHKEADEYFEDLVDMDFSSTGWLTRFKTLKERLEHHMDEEEDEIFAAAKKDISKQRANELAKIFDERKPVEKQEVA